MSPDALVIRDLIARARRRLDTIAALTGGTIGLTVALGAVFVLWAVHPPLSPVADGIIVALAALFAGIAVAVVLRRNGESIAAAVERRAPSSRNVILTAAELIDARSTTNEEVRALIYRRAATAVESIDVRKLFPIGRVTAGFVAIVLAWTFVLGASGRSPSSGTSTLLSSKPSSTITGVSVVVAPPAYAARSTETLQNPASITALVGSVVHLTVRSAAMSVTIETVAGKQTLSLTDSSSRERVFRGDVAADADGFIAVEATTAGAPATRRLIGLTVSPDHPPRVKITAPGRDLFIADPKRRLDVAIEADDDLALSSLRLRYTKVSGSGERFTFVEGETSVAVDKKDERSWKASGTLRLDSLALAPGDMIVYRGVATDRRPGAPPVESDAFIVEITAPGMVAAEGFALDDTENKYALSQQMVILKTERLIAAARTLATDTVSERALDIAAEQRAVRAEFVFMMGGELAEEVIAAAGLTELNEVAEAEGESDLAAGRLQNRGRVALVQAIRYMSRANASLVTSDMTKALSEEKAALGYLQQAFSRTRYLLRALTLRERLDLSRRLTGVLATAARDERPIADVPVDPRVTSLRALLSQIAGVAGRPTLPADLAPDVSRFGQSVIAVDPSSTALRNVAASLTDAARAVELNKNDEARRSLDAAVIALGVELRSGLPTAPANVETVAGRRLDGALADALRRSPR